MERTSLPIDDIRTDGGTQPRAFIDARLVTEYSEAMEDDRFPAVVVFFDGESHWLADGFHRLAAARSRGESTIECEVKQGTREDAVWFSCGANARHGSRRTNKDKRRAVETALGMPMAEGMSLRALARHCGVSHSFVASMKRRLAGEESEDDDDALEAAPSDDVIDAATAVTGTSENVVIRDEAPERPARAAGGSTQTGGHGGGDGTPREVTIDSGPDRPATTKRSIKLPRDPRQAANVLLKNFGTDELELIVDIVSSNLDAGTELSGTGTQPTLGMSGRA